LLGIAQILDREPAANRRDFVADDFVDLDGFPHVFEELAVELLVDHG